MLTYPADMEFIFGESRVLPARRELAYRNGPVRVGDRAFDILLLLLEEPGVVVSKSRIMETVWARRVVEDNTLERQMSILRHALQGDRIYIKTIAGRGYQFVGELERRSEIVEALEMRGDDGPQLHRGICLPVPVSRLIGRHVELTEITTLLRTKRMVTLLGAGGVGKTRLAIEAARAVSSNFGDGVFFAEFAATASADHVASKIEAALGFPIGAVTGDPEDVSLEWRDQHFLLVIDNCEHLVDGVARITEALLKIAPGVTVLATSRESLRISGEYIYRVPSLEVPTDDSHADVCSIGSVELLLDRIGSGVSVVDSPNTASLLGRICRQLDGIPLAIELAAACTQVFGLEGVASRLDDRFDLLRFGTRTALPRQRTLRATVDWSYDLLPEKWKAVLNRLSIFADAFTLESACQMISSADLTEVEVTIAIFELINKSLLCLIPDSPNIQYRLLDTIRAYAREKLVQSGTYRKWCLRHAQHFLRLFLVGQDLDNRRVNVDQKSMQGPHIAELRAAIAWSFSAHGEPHIAVELVVAGVKLLMKAGLAEECLNYVNVALNVLLYCWQEIPRAPIDQYEMKLHAARASCLLYQGAGTDTSNAFLLTHELAAKNDNVEYQLLGLWGNWSCAHLNGRNDEALSIASRFTEIASRSCWTADPIVGQRLSAIAHMCLGELERSRVELERICDSQHKRAPIERIRFLYDEHMLARTALSQTLSLLGLHSDARREAQKALEDAQELRHGSSICYALSEGVCPAALLGHDDVLLEEAVHRLDQETRRHGASTWKARAKMWLGLLELRAGRVDAYRSNIAPALATIGNACHCVVLAPFLSESANALARLGSIDEANHLLDRAIAWNQQTPGLLALFEIQRAKAEIQLYDFDGNTRERMERLLRNVVDISRRRGFNAWADRTLDTLERLNRQAKYNARRFRSKTHNEYRLNA